MMHQPMDWEAIRTQLPVREITRRWFWPDDDVTQQLSPRERATDGPISSEPPRLGETHEND